MTAMIPIHLKSREPLLTCTCSILRTNIKKKAAAFYNTSSAFMDSSV
jgi:hypothetical protein